MEKKRKRRTGLKILIIFVLIIAILMFFLSSIIKWYVENNGEKIIGRKISITELHINYLKFSVSAKGFVLYEKDAKQTFLGFDEMVIDMDPWRLLKNQYAFSEIKLVNPTLSVVADEKGFNFDDIIEHLTEGEEPEEESSDTIKYLVKNLTVTGGHLRYEDKTINSVTELKNLGLNIPEIAWDNSRSDLGIEFEMGENGKVSLAGTIDQAKAKYEVTAKTENIDITPFKSYFNDYVDAGSITGNLYSDIKIAGSLTNLMNIEITGEAGVTNLMITDPTMIPFMSADKVHLELESINLWRENYDISKMLIENPKINTTLSSKGANYDIVLAPYWADTIPDPNDTVEMHYSVQELTVVNGNIAYADYTLNRPFLLDISQLNFTMRDYTDLATRVPMEFTMNLNDQGKLSGKATVNMYTLETFYLEAILRDLDMVFLSPYSEYYLARPILKGTFNYDCSIYLTPAAMESENHIRILDLDMGKKTKDTTAYKVPIGLALYVLKDRNDVIDFDLPVSGDPSDPKFKVRKIIWKTLEEFLIKTAAAPFNAIGNAVGGNPEKIKQINFEWLQDSLNTEQRQNLEKIAGFIKKKGELAFVFTQTTDPDTEKALIAVYETKLMYLRALKPDADFNSLKQEANEMIDNTSEFLTYLGLGADADNNSIRKACMTKYTPEKAQSRLNQLLALRENLIKAYFAENKVPVEAYSFKTVDFRNLPDEMKTPKFTIDVTLR